MKSGFVTILGRPNVGKSTLLNNLIRAKVSIISSKAQTTRDNIQGIYNDEDSQIVFVDTPGIHNAKYKLGEYMNKSAYSMTKDVDAIILLVDASLPYDEDFKMKDLSKAKCPLFIVYNKIDLTNVQLIEKLKEMYHEHYPEAIEVEISALENVNIDLLLSKIKEVLPEGPKYYDDDTISNKPRSFLMKEIIREKILKCTKEEIPHSVAVTLDSIKETEKRLKVKATIIVDRLSQKMIIVGKNGAMVSKIRQLAEFDMSKLFSRRVDLEIFVRVEEDWRNKAKYLKEFGYSEK